MGNLHAANRWLAVLAVEVPPEKTILCLAHKIVCVLTFCTLHPTSRLCFVLFYFIVVGSCSALVISFRFNSLVLVQSYDGPNASESAMVDMGRVIVWIAMAWCRNYSKLKHNTRVCISCKCGLGKRYTCLPWMFLYSRLGTVICFKTIPSVSYLPCDYFRPTFSRVQTTIYNDK